MKDDPGTTTAWTFRRLFSGSAGLGLVGVGLTNLYALATAESFAFSWKGGDAATYAWPEDRLAILLFFLVAFGGGALCLLDFLRSARPRP